MIIKRTTGQNMDDLKEALWNLIYMLLGHCLYCKYLDLTLELKSQLGKQKGMSRLLCVFTKRIKFVTKVIVKVIKSFKHISI